MSDSPAGGQNNRRKVLNLSGTSDNTPCKKHKTWLSHWKELSKSTRTRCAALNCNKDAAVGAHIQVQDGRTPGNWYIVPFCNHCNSQRGEALWLEKDVMLVSARKADCDTGSSEIKK